MQNYVTSPSGEKLNAEITVVTAIPEDPARKRGSPGGALASRTLIFITLFRQRAGKEK